MGTRDHFVIGGGDNEAFAGKFHEGFVEVEFVAQEQAGGNPGVMRGGDFSEAEERRDEDEGVEFFGVFGEDGFRDASAEALAAEDDLGVAMRAGEF